MQGTSQLPNEGLGRTTAAHRVAALAKGRSELNDGPLSEEPYNGVFRR